jgi:SAM-dependent methyltransferase
MKLIDRERFEMGSLPIWVFNEHQARWRFASRYVAGKIVVDCACGVGLGSAMFAASGANRVYAFDLSEDAVAAATKNCSINNNVSVARADGRDLPLASRSVDLFVSFETIEHVDDDHGFLNEVARVLVPGGTFICSTPNRMITMPGKLITDTPWNPFHVREYNQNDFTRLLTDHFESVRLFGQNPKTQMRAQILNFLGKFLPGHAGGRINSALKLPRFAYDKESHHCVIDFPGQGTCEYLVAVCVRPLS